MQANKQEIKNPWLPWTELQKKRPIPNEGTILAIIPTAGKNVKKLQECFNSLKMAANGIPLQVVIVNSPVSQRSKQALNSAFRDKAELVYLSGKFNYCRSINEGLRRLQQKDRFVLFLNDDVTFTNPGDLRILRDTLCHEGWACIGPHILYNPEFHDPTWPKNKSSLKIIAKECAERANTPISGSCSLWDTTWTQRVGELDVEFGNGWGMDEADLCLRTVRLGGIYGRQDRVRIEHVMHASFGREYTRYLGPAHMHSLKYFKAKYGNDVEEWGRSHHWFPLPGIQVCSVIHDGNQSVEGLFTEVSDMMKGYNWIHLIVYSGNDQKTLNEIKTYAYSVQEANAVKYVQVDLNEKADSFANRFYTLGEEYHRSHPAILFAPTGKSLPHNMIKVLMWRIRDGGYYRGCYPDSQNISVLTSNHSSTREIVEVKNIDAPAISNTISHFSVLRNPL